MLVVVLVLVMVLVLVLYIFSTTFPPTTAGLTHAVSQKNGFVSLP